MSPFYFYIFVSCDLVLVNFGRNKSVVHSYLLVSNTAVQCGQVSVGDFVAVKPDDPSVPLYIGKVMYLYQSGEKFSKDQTKAHIMWLT